MSEAEHAPSPDQKPDWRDKALRKKHAKILRYRRENEELKRLLGANGIPMPEPDDA